MPSTRSSRRGLAWANVRDSLWFIPTLAVLAGSGLAMLAVQIPTPRAESRLAWVWLFGGAEGARGVLTAIAGSLITVTGTVFSVTIVALQLASSQFTPRLLRSFVADRVNQAVLGVFIGTFTYTLLVLRTIAEGSKEDRDRASLLLARFLLSGPVLAGLLHADPHPGNFRLLPDGRLGVIDFGATARLPDGHPEPIGRLLRWALAGRAAEVLADLRSEGFILPEVDVDPEGVLEYLRPLLEPVAGPRFHFTRAWMQQQAARIADPRTEANRLGRQLNLPPAYLLIHRVTIGSIGVLCQLDAEADWRTVLEKWLPGFAE